MKPSERVAFADLKEAHHYIHEAIRSGAMEVEELNALEKALDGLAAAISLLDRRTNLAAKGATC